MKSVLYHIFQNSNIWQHNVHIKHTFIEVFAYFLLWLVPKLFGYVDTNIIQK